MPKKKKKSVKSVIQSLGLFYLIHPDNVRNTWQGTFSFETGSVNPYSSSKTDIQGVIRLSVAGEKRIDALKESARTVDVHTTDSFIGEEEVVVKESVVASTFYDNPEYSAILKGKDSERESNLKSEILNLKSLTDLVEHIRTIFDTKFYLKYEARNITYITAFVIVVVDNMALFHEIVKHIDPKPLMDGNQSVKIYRFQNIIDDDIPYISEASAFPLHVLVVENSESINWLENGVVPKKTNSTYFTAINVRDYLFHIYRLELIDTQLHWINARCKTLMETIPRDKPQTVSGREKRFQQLIDVSMNLEFYYTSYVMAKDFIIREQEEDEKILSNYWEFPTKSRIQETLTILEETLNHLKNSLQTRITLEGLLVEKHKAEQQARTEKKLGLLQLYFATFVLFEVTGTYLAWVLEPTIFESHLMWLMVMIFAGLLMVYGIWSLSKEDKEIEQSNSSSSGKK